MTGMNIIAENITRRRKELNMTQRELAEKLDISDKTVSRWETGNQVPDALMIPKLAESLKIDIQELYGLETKKETLGEAEKHLDISEAVASFKGKVILGAAFGCVGTRVLWGNATNMEETFLFVLLIVGIAILIVAATTFKAFYRHLQDRTSYDEMVITNLSLAAFVIFLSTLLWGW